MRHPLGFECFWNICEHSEGLGLCYFLASSDMISGVNIETFRKVPRPSLPYKTSWRLLMILRHLWCLRVFLGYFLGVLVSLSYSNKFLKILRHSLICLDIPRLCKAISFVLSCSEKFLNNLSSSLTFKGALRISEVIWGILLDSKQVWKLPEGSESYSVIVSLFWGVLRCSRGFWAVLNGS